MTPTLTEITDVLSRTPDVLTALLDGAPADVLSHRVTPDSFSPLDVVGHLIHGERTDWVPRVRHILAVGDAAPFTPFDRRGFEDSIRGVGIATLLAEFRSLRTANLDDLRGLRLTEDRLSLRGRHPELGGVTLGQLLATWAAHDLNHLDQVARVISHRYSDAVGPWKAYLGVLNR